MSSAVTRCVNEIAIFWDYENVPLPDRCNPAEVSKCIHNAVSKYGRIVDRRLYADSRKFNVGLNLSNRRFLDSSGFDLVDTPSKGGKESLDKKMIADILLFAWDCAVRNETAKPCVVLVTSDGDYAYTLAKLRDRGVMSVVFYGRECTVAQVLVDNADVALSFEKDVLSSIVGETVLNGSMLPDTDNGSSSSTMFFSHDVEGAEWIDAGQARVMHKHFPVDDLDLFCISVHNILLLARKKTSTTNNNLSEVWATDLHVGGYFKKVMSPEPDVQGYSDKYRYQSIRARAISENLVQAGRRILNSPFGRKEIIGVSWDEATGKTESLSSELYLCLTPNGMSKVENFRARTGSDMFLRLDVAEAEKDWGSFQGMRDASPTRFQNESVGESMASDIDTSPQFISHSVSTNLEGSSKIISAKVGDGKGVRQWLCLFCRCVHGIQLTMSAKGLSSFENSWAADALVAEAFLEHTTKDRYKDIRELAIMNRLVCPGRRLRNSTASERDVVEVNWCENAGQGESLSDEFYLRLTERGVSYWKRLTPNVSAGEETSIHELGNKYGCLDEMDATATVADKISDRVTGITSGGDLTFSTTRSLDLSELNKKRVKYNPEEKTSWGRAQVEPLPSPKPVEIVSVEEGAVVLRSCVEKMQVFPLRNSGAMAHNNTWVTDSMISALFKSEAPWKPRNVRITSKDYKNARERAILGGLVDAGRRKLKSQGVHKEIVKVNWHENAGKSDELASEVYLRLPVDTTTIEGESVGSARQKDREVGEILHGNDMNGTNTQKMQTVSASPKDNEGGEMFRGIDAKETEAQNTEIVPQSREVVAQNTEIVLQSREVVAQNMEVVAQNMDVAANPKDSEVCEILRGNDTKVTNTQNMEIVAARPRDSEDGGIVHGNDTKATNTLNTDIVTEPATRQFSSLGSGTFSFSDVSGKRGHETSGDMKVSESSSFMKLGLVSREQDDEMDLVAALGTPVNAEIRDMEEDKDVARTGFSTSGTQLLDSVTDSSTHDTKSSENTSTQRSISTLESDTSSDSGTFLACVTKAHLLVMKKGNSAGDWATDSAVAGNFLDEISFGANVNRTTMKQRYKKIREKTIREGLVEAGRRRLDCDEKMKQIDTISWSEINEKSENLSPELYLRLTESGGSVVASSQYINLS